MREKCSIARPTTIEVWYVQQSPCILCPAPRRPGPRAEGAEPPAPSHALRLRRGLEQEAQGCHLHPSPWVRHPVGQVRGHDVRRYPGHLRRFALRDAEVGDRREVPHARHPAGLPDNAHRGHLASPQRPPQDLVRPRASVSPTSSVNLIPG